MKISYRILFINFAVVALVLGSSAVAFYTVMYNVLTSQQSKYLLKSANEFIYSYREILQNTEDEFKSAGGGWENIDVKESAGIDFIIAADANGNNIISKGKNIAQLPAAKFDPKEFLNNNPLAVIKTVVLENGVEVYYGKILTSEVLSSIAKKTGSETAVIWNGSAAEVSNPNINQAILFDLNEAYKNLSNTGNFTVYTKESSASDIAATIYKPNQDVEVTGDIEFIIFNSVSEAAELRTNLTYILIIIGFTGITISLILSFVFTDKIRKRITRLSKAAEITKEGSFAEKIEVKGKDELAQLASAFNEMLEELEKNQKSKNEYSEFITLINRNPTLKEIADAALEKIISSCGFIVGALYSVDNGKFGLNSAYGFKPDDDNLNYEYFENVIKSGEKAEIAFDEDYPAVYAGAVRINLRYMLLVPVLYNQKVIALIQLGGVTKPSAESKEYISKIQDQLAIGLTNAQAHTQLENFVSILQNLNDDYQKQNIQVRKQNETLVDLHAKLKEKALELEVQKEKAEESTKLKSQFLASMSHELRTPMNSILGLTELILEESSLKGKNRERLEVVLKSGKRLMMLINDILDLSKIEAGKMELHKEDVLLEELVHEVETSISPLIIRKNLELKITRSSGTNIIINTDKGKITQVLINLLGNAVKFTESGTIELKVTTSGYEKLVFEVIDSGIGISEEDQCIIFDEFRQLDGTTTRKYNGTGLGLTICKKIADLFGGDISVKSTLGAGSTFTFSVPLNFVEVHENTTKRKINIETLIKNRQNPILVIDDDPEVRYTIGEYLISKGYDVIYAEDGEKGIKEAISRQPFAITLDIMMPGKDGFTVLRELKDNPATKDIPVILLSIISNKNLGYGLGAFEYFVKPISQDKLLSAFNKLENLAKKKIERIVIVDDDELEFEKFKKEFGGENIRIEYIKESSLAFNKIREIQPDLIIVDLLMPEVDGITLSYKLKASRDTKHIPIIISTAKDLSTEEGISLQNIVENVTVKSKGHPLDVLKIVRDRIKMHEQYSSVESIDMSGIEEALLLDLEEESEQELGDTIGEVLLVDDDEDTLFTINEIVRSCDCSTTMVRSGAECLRSLEQKIPDLILLDIMMPEMDGFQTIKRIKENPRWANIPVFAVTAKAMVNDKQVILKNGFDDYVAKPVNAGILAFKIRKILVKVTT